MKMIELSKEISDYLNEKYEQFKRADDINVANTAMTMLTHELIMELHQRLDAMENQIGTIGSNNGIHY